MVEIVIFAIHMFGSLFLFLCLPLPFLYYAARLEGGRFKELLLKVYKVIFLGAHVALFLLIATGVPLIDNWSSGWTWLVIIDTIVIGSSLGLSTKAVRKLREDNGEEEGHIRLLKQSSLVLAGSIFVMFVLKYGVYFI